MSKTISQASRLLSVSTRTLRYYEELGLIISRRQEGYACRIYDEDTLERNIAAIKLDVHTVAFRDTDMGGLLEEHLNAFHWPEDESKQQLDLYLPIRRKV